VGFWFTVGAVTMILGIWEPLKSAQDAACSMIERADYGDAGNGWGRVNGLSYLRI